MALTQVTRHNSGGFLPLCSCGWEGKPEAVRSEAYAVKHRHQRQHRELDAAETVNETPGANSIRVLWQDPATPTLSQIADSATKMRATSELDEET